MAALGTCIGSFTPPALPYGTMCRTIMGGSPPGLDLVETRVCNLFHKPKSIISTMKKGPIDFSG